MRSSSPWSSLLLLASAALAACSGDPSPTPTPDATAPDVTADAPTSEDVAVTPDRPAPPDRPPVTCAAEDLSGMSPGADGSVRVMGTTMESDVTRFGAFIDLGIKQDGLIHISELSDRFVNDPAEVVAVRQQVKVRVLSVDLQRRRIALSMKGLG